MNVAIEEMTQEEHEEEVRLHNLQIARESSWLCRMFQASNLRLEEKQKVIRKMMNQKKKK